MPNIRHRGPTSNAHVKPDCCHMTDPDSFYLPLSHPMICKIVWCPHCATEPKRRYPIIQRPQPYDEETSRVLLNLTLRDGWTLLPPRRNMLRSSFLKKTYKDLQQFANRVGVPLLVSPTAHPIIMRPSEDTVDFTDIVHYMEGHWGQTSQARFRHADRRPPPPPPPGPLPQDTGEGVRERRVIDMYTVD